MLCNTQSNIHVSFSKINLNNPIWSKIVRNGLKLFKMIQNCLKIQNGSQLSTIGKYVLIMSTMDKNGFKKTCRK